MTEIDCNAKHSRINLNVFLAQSENVNVYALVELTVKDDMKSGSIFSKKQKTRILFMLTQQVK